MKCKLCSMTLNDATDPSLSVQLRAQGLDERQHIVDEKLEFLLCKGCWGHLKALIQRKRLT